MDNRREKEAEGRFHECGFDFKKFEKMAEMMKGCCVGGRMMDCCSMMRNMIKESAEKEKERE